MGNLVLDGLSKADTPFAIYLTIEGVAAIVVLAVLFAVLNRLTTSRRLRA